jgi:hypothetical protein
MSPRKIEIANELIEEGKRLYEETLTPLCDVAALMGISRRTLENRIREWNWRRRRIASRPIELFHAMRGAAVAAATDPARPVDATSQPVSPQQRNALAARIQEAVEREINAVEQVLAALSPADPAEAERSSRTLASLARTLREVAALNQPDQQAAPDEADDDPVPSDIDEFRRELARRIRGFIEARRHGAGRVSDEPESALG